jgi:hypothetical protein
LDGVARGGGGTRGRGLRTAADRRRPLDALIVRLAAAYEEPRLLSDKDALLVGTGRRAPADAEKAELGELAAKLPLVLG